MTERADLEALPRFPKDEAGPVFREPWEAKAFALTLALHQRGVFRWTEWAATLGREIAEAGDDDGEHYYEHWLHALEHLVVDKGLASTGGLEETAAAWLEAAEATPHGQPIMLPGGV